MSLLSYAVLQYDEIAIVMPVKNVAPWISDCVNSILNQSYPHFKLYVVDDHSTDRTLHILKDFALEDQRIIVLNNNGKGIVDALTTAYNQSTERLITRMDGDDVMPMNKLALFIEAFQQHPKAVISGKVEYFSNKPISKGYLDYQTWLNNRIDENDFQRWKYRECVIASANWMTSRGQIDAIGGFASLDYPEDYDMVLKWLSKNTLFKGIDAVTHYWREHPDRTSRNSHHYQQATFFQLKINHWIEHDYESDRPTFLIGKGKKQQLVSHVLNKRIVAHETLNQESYSTEELTQLLKEHSNAQLLICIYPPKKPRIRLESWLQLCGFKLGTNCWYV
jgi:glycosyltransferase involved in cell wall biosynthesis